MARTWNDLLYGPPPRRNRSEANTPPVESDSDSDSEFDSDIDSEYERELEWEARIKQHRCFNKCCRCFEKDKENWYTSTVPVPEKKPDPRKGKKKNVRPVPAPAPAPQRKK